MYQIDPTKDARWTELIARHGSSSVFHTVAWLEALRLTYSYEPVVFTTSPPGCQLRNALVFCRIDSRLTGRRIVSLPFSDHCEPLCDSIDDIHCLVRYLQGALGLEKWDYLEIRPVSDISSCPTAPDSLVPSGKYFLHLLDLRPNLSELFGSFDKDCVRRRIQRAERGGLVERCGRSDDLLRQFYTLFVATRKRHHLPPIPYKWFRNLIRLQGEALEIRVAYAENLPIASILTIRYKDTVYYKYGCSEASYKNYGAIPWLLWRAIQAAKLGRATTFDLGRTDADNMGLLAFKNRWVHEPRPLVYWKYPATAAFDSRKGWKLQIAKRLFSVMPNAVLRIAGNMIYRHIG